MRLAARHAAESELSGGPSTCQRSGLTFSARPYSYSHPTTRLRYFWSTSELPSDLREEWLADGSSRRQIRHSRGQWRFIRAGGDLCKELRISRAALSQRDKLPTRVSTVQAIETHHPQLANYFNKIECVYFASRADRLSVLPDP